MEKIITEKITVINTEQTAFQFEMIQESLDEGWMIKQMFCTPLKGGYNTISEIAITVHLQKSI